MQIYKPLTHLPADIQADWQAALHPATPTARGAFRLVAVRRTDPKGFQSQRITVLVVDENGFPMPNVRVAFAYSTAPDYHTVTPDFLWAPPEQRAFIVPTSGGGQCDQIQGSPVKQGQPGGVTVFIWEPEYSSDVVTGLGMLADHSGIYVTFQLLRAGVTPLPEWLAAIERRLALLEGIVYAR